jgi:hypothetical protein
MCNTLNKIKEYQSILKVKNNDSVDILFDSSEEINIGIDLSIIGIYLDDSRKNYVIARLNGYKQIEFVIDIDVLDDVILQKISHILSTKIS